MKEFGVLILIVDSCAKSPGLFKSRSLSTIHCPITAWIIIDPIVDENWPNHLAGNFFITIGA